jgi:hypothetical protein
MSAARQAANMAGSPQRSLLLTLGPLGGVAHAFTTGLSIVVLDDSYLAGSGASTVGAHVNAEQSACSGASR